VGVGVEAGTGLGVGIGVGNGTGVVLSRSEVASKARGCMTPLALRRRALDVEVKGALSSAGT
jgi:hypothetical protein